MNVIARNLVSYTKTVLKIIQWYGSYLSFIAFPVTELPPGRMTPLKVDKIDACIRENVRQHHTDVYDLMRTDNDQLIVRRGQPFNLRLKLDRDYSPQNDRLSLVFYLTGNQTLETEVVVPVMDYVQNKHDADHSWYASVVNHGDRYVHIKVQASPSCAVGEWQLQVDTKLHHDDISSSTYYYPGSIIILINPWCQNDRVYIEDDCYRHEYVLSESDMFTGSKESTPWLLDQFEPDMQQCTDSRPVVQAGNYDAVYMITKPSTVEEEQLLLDYITDEFEREIHSVPVTFEEFTDCEQLDEKHMKFCGLQCEIGSTAVICEVDNTRRPMQDADEDLDNLNTNAMKDEDDLKSCSQRDEPDIMISSYAQYQEDCTDLMKEDATKLSDIEEQSTSKETVVTRRTAVALIDNFHIELSDSHLRVKADRYLNRNQMFAPDLRGPLNIQTIDQCISVNGVNHHTDQYSQMRAEDCCSLLVVRRGQPFYLHVTVDRGYFPRDDGLSLVFQLAGNKKRLTSSTDVIVPVTQLQKDEYYNYGWSASVVYSEGNCIYMKVQASVECLVGEYKMQVDTKLQGDLTGCTYALPQSVVILFNPWCQFDQVYMEDENLRNEYVLSDCGVMFSGSRNSVQPTPWFYGQFEQGVLQSALLMLPSLRPDAFNVVRNIVTTLSVDNGPLAAEGSGQHGVWTGSVDILAEYYRTMRPVRCGHSCLVFAGVCTTVCRALGVPCRPVTVYNAARDDGLLVDLYLGESGNQLFADDTIWAYRVWNEVWIERPDLQPGGEYYGWNVMDATPGKRRNGDACGPASVKAVKLGETLKAYDTDFVHDAVNASVVVWKHVAENKPLKFVSMNRNWIGSLIVTKSLASNGYTNITADYKSTERYQEEFGMVEECLQALTNRTIRYYVNSDFRWINCELVLPDSTMIGSPIIVNLIIRNIHHTNEYNVDVKMTVGIQNHTNDTWFPVKSEEFNLQVLPNREGVTLALIATYEDYKLSSHEDDECFKVICSVFVPEVDYDYVKEDVITLSKPKLEIKLRRVSEGRTDAQSGEQVHAVATFRNPLPEQLTNCVFQFEGPDNKQTVQLDSPVPPYEVATANCRWGELSPSRCTVVGTFTSNQLTDVRGICRFTQT